MAAPSYKARGLVLRKTKLGEKDLIITLLGEQGALIKAIAKGARKPGGSHAAKLELFSVVDGLFVKGKNLDIISESKLVNSGSVGTLRLEQTAVATPLAELLSFVAQEDLEQHRLFELSIASFERIKTADNELLLTLCAASLWKVLSQTGFRPSILHCISCGREIDFRSDRSRSANQDLQDSDSNRIANSSSSNRNGTLSFSAVDGGVLCQSCIASSDSLRVDASILEWCNYLIGEPYDSIVQHPMNPPCAFEVISLARLWTRVHIGKDLKSLDFLFSSGLFDND